jgi:hypothetical protein
MLEFAGLNLMNKKVTLRHGFGGHGKKSTKLGTS